MDAELVVESRPRFTAKGKRNLGEPVIEPVGAASTGSDKRGETFGDGATRTGGLRQEK